MTFRIGHKRWHWWVLHVVMALVAWCVGWSFILFTETMVLLVGGVGGLWLAWYCSKIKREERD